MCLWICHNQLFSGNLQEICLFQSLIAVLVHVALALTHVRNWMWAAGLIFLVAAVEQRSADGSRRLSRQSAVIMASVLTPLA